MNPSQLEQQAVLLEAMQNPAIYDHPVGQFQLIETHISWVLLTGSYVYKIKKAVDFGFLDYSTLKKRHTQCEEELRLNRRTAPELYLEVVAIGGTVQKPLLSDVTVPIEYAVKMRQFDQESLFSRLLKAGQLTEKHITELAGTVAAFHSRVEAASAESPYGAPDAVYYPITENFRHIGKLISEPETVERLARLESWSRTRFDELKEFIKARKQQGFVRECHGDLHLNNITLIDGVPVLFDCIEFNPSFRFIDTISEIAFLVMDLEENHRPDYATLFLNSYLQQTGDYAGCRLLRFYQCYRAMVRAKVATLMLDQNNFLGYLSQAENYTKPTQPQLIITRGLSGSGKSYISDQLLRHLMAIHLRSDIERKRLFGLKPEEKSDSALASGIYSSEATENTYNRLLEQAKTLLTAGLTVIVDATFSDRSLRDPFRNMAEALGCRFTILDITADQQLLRDRILQRQRSDNDPSEAGISVLEHQLQRYTPLDRDELGNTISINSGQSLDFKSMAEQIQEITP